MAHPAPSRSGSTPATDETGALRAQLERLQRRLDRERRARVEAERLLEDKSASLYEALERLRSEAARVRALAEAIETASDGIALTDAHGHFVDMNAAHARLFGYRVDDLAGAHWSVLYDPPARRMLEQTALPAAMQDGAWRGEVVGRACDGTPVFQEVVLGRRSGGGLVCTTRDTSERRRREHDVRELESRLLKAEREAALFTIGNAVAHDFNNLIAAISGYALLLQAETEPGSSPHERAGRIAEAAEQAAAVVRSLEVERSQDVRSVETIDLSRILRTGLAIAEAIRPDEVEIDVEIVETAPVPSNEVLLSRALLNITKNAFEAMAGEGRISVRLGPQPGPPLSPGAHLHRIGAPVTNPLWVIEITDTGPGIAADKLQRIFAPFETTKKARQGSGLGLLSLAALADSRTASVEVESKPGRGTRFRLLFPDRTQPRPVREQVVGPGEIHGVARILLVDDNTRVGEMLAETVEALGYEAEWFADPLVAIAEIESGRADLDVLITDLTMPGLNGDGLARRAKAARPDLPVILYSGQSGYVPADALFSAVLTKPIRPHDLRQAIESGLRNRGWRALLGL